GTAETLLDDASRLAERARKAGVTVSYEASENMIHVWHLFAPMLDEGQQAIDRIGQFVRKQAAGSRADARSLCSEPAMSSQVAESVGAAPSGRGPPPASAPVQGHGSFVRELRPESEVTSHEWSLDSMARFADRHPRSHARPARRAGGRGPRRSDVV